MTTRSLFGEKTTPSAYAIAYTGGLTLPSYALREEKDGVKKKAASISPKPKITNYLNKNTRWSDRKKLKDKMLGFLGLLRSKTSRHEFVVQGRPGENTRIGTRVANKRTEYVLVHGFTGQIIMDCFTGQGSLVVYKNLLPLMEFAHACGKSGHPTTISFQTILDQHMGLDCTGFVGSYLMQKYSFINQMPTQTFYFQTAHHYKKHSVFRERLTDIQQDDVLVWEDRTSPKKGRNKNAWHVALVDSVVCTDGKKAIKVKVSEAYSGLSTHTWKIEQSGKVFRTYKYGHGWNGDTLSCIAKMTWLPMPG